MSFDKEPLAGSNQGYPLRGTEEENIDQILQNFLKHVPAYEKHNILKSLKAKFQRR